MTVTERATGPTAPPLERPVLRVFALTVSGTPAEQGSKSAIPYTDADGRQHARVIDTPKQKIKDWRADVKAAAERVMATTEAWEGPLTGPLNVVAHFTLYKPKLPRRVRWMGMLVEAIHWPAGKRNDLDKLLRGTFDALTAAGVWDDDGQVVELRASKAYPGTGSHALTTPGLWLYVSQVNTLRIPAAPVLGPTESVAMVTSRVTGDPILEEAAVGRLF